jgi:ribosomal protein S18 acetylase RimI-like enzyme
LLVDALRRAQHLADQIGIRAVEVDAINEAARAFYEKYGFVRLRDDSRHLFLPMRVIRKLQLPRLS